MKSLALMVLDFRLFNGAVSWAKFIWSSDCDVWGGKCC